MSIPRVSCLMVTANRTRLAKRAIRCFIEQRYENKELIVVDDGQEDYRPLLRDIPPEDVRYIKLPPANHTLDADCRVSAVKLNIPGVEAINARRPVLYPRESYLLGTLRNISLAAARGDFMVQWDDDDWYHPDRIARQAAVLLEGYDACWLSASLMHLDNPELFHLPYIGWLPDGIPGSIMHRVSRRFRYPELSRGEDTEYQKLWKRGRCMSLPESDAGLFIRCYHGRNTWEQEHFVRRMRNSPLGLLKYLYYSYVRRDLSRHPLFRLSAAHREAFELYVKQSREVGLFNGAAETSPS